VAIALDTLSLPDDLLWQDEFSWNPVAGSSGRTLQGRFTFQTAGAAGESGRPITLGNEHAWLTRSDLLTLQAWSTDPYKRMSLTLHDGSVRDVVFRHWEPPVVEAAPVVDFADPDAATLYRLLKLKMVVS